jgi:hypothetical protein
MAIPSRQIGWGTEENLLWEISKQIERLTCVTAGGCGSLITTTTTSTTAAPAYRVFTALLTQSGEDSPTLVIDLPLVPGITYEIIDNDGSTADFTNVGAPNNNVGTFFVATGSTPNSWGDNLLGQLQFNEGAPVVTVLENTIGNIWFTYQNVGQYGILSNALFQTEKTTLSINLMGDDTSTGYVCLGNIEGISGLKIYTGILTGNEDNVLIVPTPIEIRVYN